MKTFITILLLGYISAFADKAFAGRDTSINQLAVMRFNETFPRAEKVSWREFEDRYAVHFEHDDIKTVVNYDKEGNYISSLRYYEGRYLPVNIHCKLQKKYSDKRIAGITESSSENGTEYYIKMQDDKTWITVKSDANGMMEVVENFKK